MLTGKSGSVYTRTADGRVFHDRRIKYHQFPSQRQFHNCCAKCKGFSGPIGSGKSKALVHEAIKRAYLNPGCQGLIAGPTYRMLADVGNPDRSRWQASTGQSGQPGSPHYEDLIPSWRDGRSNPAYLDEHRLREAGGSKHLRLEPE